MPTRSYRQYCAVARALDVVGDRWNLLIVRNLILGPQNWSELRTGLPGVAKNLLSERLKLFIAHGVVSHDAEQYSLTELGRELEPIVFALANWGERHFLGPPAAEDEFRLRYLMTSVRRKLSAGGARASLQIWVDDAAFWVELGPEATVGQGERDADATLRCGVAGIRAFLFGSAPVEELAADGLLTVVGEQLVVERFRRAVG